MQPADQTNGTKVSLLRRCQQAVSVAPGPIVNPGGFAPTSSSYQDGNTNRPTASWEEHPAMDAEGLLTAALCDVLPAHPIRWHIQGCM